MGSDSVALQFDFRIKEAPDETISSDFIELYFCYIILSA